MYKTYPPEDHLRVTDECAARLRTLLQARYAELEELRDAINDRYPFEDLYLRQDAVDDEEYLIRDLLARLEVSAEARKAAKRASMETWRKP